MTNRCKVTAVPNRLGQLLRKPGGVSRGLALKVAGRNVENLREEFVGAIPGEIAALEAILTAGHRQRLAPQELEAMLTRAAQILTLSGTYGFDGLDTVVKRFCDLAVAMLENGVEEVAPLHVHLRAMRLVAPGAPDIGEPEVAHVLKGLAAVRAHLFADKTS